jgi:aspartate aminotransferase-like enzyme
MDLNEKIVLVPGPTNLSQRVLRALSKPQISHTDPRFHNILLEVLDLARYVFRAKNAHTYVILGSGTAGMECISVSLVEPDEKVLVCDMGFFSRVFGKILEANGARVNYLKFGFGKHANPKIVDEALSKDSYKAVFVAHVETSSSIQNPVKEICKVARKHDVLCVVDGVSSIGGARFEFDNEKYDAVVTASQKALAGPPGLCFIALSEKAFEVMNNRKVPIRSYYMNLLNWKKVMENPKKYVATPSTNLIVAMREALLETKEEGLENRWKRHNLLAKAVRAGLEACNAKLVAEEGYRADTVTAFYTDKVDSKEIRNFLYEKFGIEVARGVFDMAEKIIRIGHFGNINARDILGLLSILEITLRRFGWNAEKGEAVKAALTYINDFVEKLCDED